MRSGTWNGRSTTDNVRVTVNGTVRPVKDVSVQSGMKDGHPAAETSSWCIEATIEWADPKTVTADSPHPFGEGTDWLPQVGDDVVIETGDGALGQWWVQHVGKIDSTSGSIADGTAVSRTVDDVDELNKQVQYIALLSRMTPVVDGESFRYQGLSSMWYVDRMLRDEAGGARGWHATPPQTWQTVGLATGLGSVRPEVGALITAHHGQSSISPPSWGRGSDDMPFPWNVYADTRLSATTNTFVLTLNFPVSSPFAEGLAHVVDENGAGCVLGLNGADRVYYGARSSSGQANFSVPRNGAKRAALYFSRWSTTSLTMTLRLDDGREFTSDTSASHPFPENWRADRVIVDSSDAVGWWMVEHDKPESQRWSSLEHVPTARIRMGVNGECRWHAARDVQWTAASSWIEEQLDAEAACVWLDEDGNFQWAGRGYLDIHGDSQTVSSALDVDGIDWQTAQRRTARKAVINYIDPRIDVDSGGYISRVLWASDSVDLAPGEEEVISVTVPSEEDWIIANTVPHHVYQYGEQWDHYTRGSTFGGTQYRKSSSDESAWCQFIDCTISKSGLRDFEVSFSPWSSISSVYRVNSSWPHSASAYMRAAESPLAIRGRGRVVWREREKSQSTGASKGGPHYRHDVGWRVQDVGGSTSDLARLLDWLADELGNPMPSVSVTLAHDPRRQIGDKIRVEDRDVTGTWVEMLVQERDTNVGGFTDTVRGRVTAHGDLADVTLLAPRGATPTTPTTTWNREVAP